MTFTFILKCIIWYYLVGVVIVGFDYLMNWKKDFQAIKSELQNLPMGTNLSDRELFKIILLGGMLGILIWSVEWPFLVWRLLRENV